jgi:hypothetical protein
MKALISPSEARGSGYRVAWVNDVEVEHSAPFFWVDCDPSVVQDQFWYDPAESTIKPMTENEQPKNQRTI